MSAPERAPRLTLDDLLARLDGVCKTSRGWSARCPAHHDRSPSLSVGEGTRGVLVHCWAGCDPAAVCAALGLTLAGLCAGDRPARGTRRDPTPRRRTAREWLVTTERTLWRRAIARELRALAVLDRARGLDVSAWTDEDRDRAMTAVGAAYHALAAAAHDHDLAAAWRALIHKRDIPSGMAA